MERDAHNKMDEKQWLTPFLKQSFVTAGVSLNAGQFGIVSSYVVAIVPQLKEPGSPIPMDDNIGSWFASIHGLSLFIGYIAVAKIISNYGRKVGNTVSSGLSLTGWACILLANNLASLLIGRFLQGLSLGLCLALGPILIAECTSPTRRGFFLSTMSACMSVGNIVAHYSASCLHWRSTALVFTVVAFVDLLICLYSPETPTWLATKSRYDDCKKVHRWLRGENEEEELLKLIQVNTEENAERKPDLNVGYFKSKIMYFISAVKKKEVYKSVTVGIHLYIICYWCGLAVFSSYPLELIHSVVGKDANITLLIFSFDGVRLVTSMIGLYVIRKLKRRTMLISSVGLNITASFVTAGYVYAKNCYVSIDVPYISIILLHVIVFSSTLGPLALPTIMCGEIFPMKYRSLAVAITRFSSSVHVFLVYKTFPDILRGVNISGSYCIFGGITLYGLVVCFFLLPETKDKTLQEIEEEFRGSPTMAKIDNSAESFL